MKELSSTAKKRTKMVARAALIAALYGALSLAVPALSFGPVQIRFGEALTILPVLMPEAIPGLVIGCLITNTLSTWGWSDIVFGTLITLIAALLTRLLRKAPPLAAIPPIALNALLLPIIWIWFGGETIYWLNVGTVAAGQTIALAVGLVLCYALKPFKKLYV